MSTVDEIFILELQNLAFVYFKVNGRILPDAMHFSLRHVGWCVTLSVTKKNLVTYMPNLPAKRLVLVLLYISVNYLAVTQAKKWSRI